MHPDRDELDQEMIEELRLLSSSGGTEELMGIVSGFVEGARRSMDEIRVALAKHDADAIAQRAHSLSGSSASLGARAVHELARQLEVQATVCRTPSDAVDLERLVDQLAVAVGNAGPALRDAFRQQT